MADLEHIEKQRVKLYKDYLKQEIDRHSQLKRYENDYKTKKQRKDVNELIDYLNSNDVKRIQERKNMAVMLKQHNSELSSLKKSGQFLQSPRSGPSFTDDLHNVDEMRMTKLKQQVVNQKYQNSNQNQAKKQFHQYNKEVQRYQDQKHIRRMKQIEQQSKKNYDGIMKKHSQNMNMFSRHQQLMNQNQTHRRAVEGFTNTEKDVLNHLWRNQIEERKKNNRYNQDQLQKQMKQFKQKRSQQKSYIQSGHELERSIFRAMLHDDSYNKKDYASYLKGQMQQEEKKKSAQYKNRKQKTIINGIFGGEHSKQRINQIQYIDKKLGIQSNHNQPTHMHNSLILQNAGNSGQSKYPLNQYKAPAEMKSLEKSNSHYLQNNSHLITPRNKSTYARDELRKDTFLSANNREENNYEQNRKQNIKINQSNKKGSNYEQKSQDHNIIELGTPYQQPSPRFFRSYDLVSGRSKFYGAG